jgi:O-acetylserine/cysteine efflux transporter
MPPMGPDVPPGESTPNCAPCVRRVAASHSGVAPARRKVKPRHVALAVLVALIWGSNFVVIKLGLGRYPPLLFSALRFACAALVLPAFSRPRVGWIRLALLGLLLFACQFGCLFLGMAHGMPPGLASVTAQTQVFLTGLFAAAFLGERPSGRQVFGTVVAFTGLALIGSTVGGDMTWTGLLFTLGAATSWAAGNILLKQVGQVDMLALVVWMSLIPPVPLFLMSLAVDGPAAVFGALLHPTFVGILAIVFNGLLATVVGFGIWAHLLRRYPAATVAPFALLVPAVGMASATVVFGERLGPARLAGALLIVAGLAVLVLRRPRTLVSVPLADA